MTPAHSKFLVGASLLGCTLLAACGQRAAHKTPDTAAMQTAPAPLDEPTLQILRAADLVLIGEVLTLEPSPGVWSSRAIAYQRVEYRVLRVLKANAKVPAAHTLKIDHPLIARSPTADASEPRLSPARFHPGVRLIIAAKRDEDDGSLQALDAARSVLAAADDTAALIEKAFTSP